MTDQVREKIAKVYELVNRGEAGEKEAAKTAIERLMRRYNLSSEEIESIKLKPYRFKYKTVLDMWLFTTLVDYFLKGNNTEIFKSTLGCREIEMKLEYLDFIVLSTAFEYFKIHMAKQYKILCLPAINRCRTTKTKNKRRAELQELFFSKYVIASKLYHKGDLTTVDLSKISEKEYRDRMRLAGIEGGNYKTQMSTGLYLES